MGPFFFSLLKDDSRFILVGAPSPEFFHGPHADSRSWSMLGTAPGFGAGAGGKLGNIGTAVIRTRSIACCFGGGGGDTHFGWGGVGARSLVFSGFLDWAPPKPRSVRPTTTQEGGDHQKGGCVAPLHRPLKKGKGFLGGGRGPRKRCSGCLQRDGSVA